MVMEHGSQCPKEKGGSFGPPFAYSVVIGKISLFSVISEAAGVSPAL